MKHSETFNSVDKKIVYLSLTDCSFLFTQYNILPTPVVAVHLVTGYWLCDTAPIRGPRPPVQQPAVASLAHRDTDTLETQPSLPTQNLSLSISIHYSLLVLVQSAVTLPQNLVCSDRELYTI